MIDKNWERMKMLEVKTWKAGIWQYLMDHATPNKSGNLYVRFTIRDKENFWGRVESRTKGEYKVVSIQRQEDKTIFLQALAKEQGFVDHLDLVTYQIKTKGSLKDKILMYCYSKLRAYFNKYECD